MPGFLSLQMLRGRSLTVSFPQSNRADRSHPLQPREFGSNGGGGSGSYDSENRLFVGNLSWGVDDASLQTMFSDYGKVMDARVVYDRETGRSHGFG
jgi:nucleolin